MKYIKIVSILGLLVLSGCVQQADVNQQPGTTSVDAVEGEKKEDKSIIDMFRQRTETAQDDPAWAPVDPAKKEEHYSATTGSLFDLNGNTDLYDDTKPHAVGEIVTILLNENNSASKSATSDISKTNASTMDPLQLGGKEMELRGYNFSYELQNSNAFNGAANANQNNSLRGEISVVVTRVFANGNLEVRGEKWMKLNTGEEYIRLSGIIRPDDIDSNNQISSTRVADARIQYSGTGDQQDSQEQGWLARFFNVVF